jgi:hypothetical protein
MNLGNSGAFCLYLWRVASAPGARYFAKNFYVAQVLGAALVKDGYLVKAIRLEADVEYRMTGGKLIPIAARSQTCSVERTSPPIKSPMRQKRTAPDLALFAVHMDS